MKSISQFTKATLIFGLLLSVSFISLKKEFKNEPPRKIIFFWQQMTKQNVRDFLLMPNAEYYLFQNYVKKDNANREKYDLLVYVYNSRGDILNRGNLRILDRNNSNPKLEPEENVNLSIYKMKRSDLENVLDEHSSYNNIIFRPVASLFNDHVDYLIYPDDIQPAPKVGTDTTIIPKSKYLYTPKGRLKLNQDYLNLNPSPPATLD